MSRTENLAPLLDLPRRRIELDGDVLRNTGAIAALGVVVEDARPLEARGWVVFADNVFDLLPGEERSIGTSGSLFAEGWNARA